MAEQEIAKHGKQVIRLLTSSEHGAGHRVREIAIEFVTILFAVLLSIWLHGWSEHRHQQDEVRTFLSGLKKDLQNDVDWLGEMAGLYRGFDANFAYLVALDPKGAPDWGKFETAFVNMDANVFFLPKKSRYDGFLMSGKLTNIENPVLLNDILTLYQSNLLQIQSSENGWRGHQNKLRDYRDDTLVEDDAAAHFRLLTAPKGKRLLKDMVTSKQLYERYLNYTELATSIIKKIDAYPGMAGGSAH